MTCEVDFKNFFQWGPHSRLVDLIRKIQEEFGRNPPIERTDLDKANIQLDEYLRQV